jgi:soluble cytochrome b562
MAMITSDRVIFVDVNDSRTASWISRHLNAAKRYIYDADDRGLQIFRGKGVRDAQGQFHPFITDLDTLDRLANTGEIEFDSIYELTL